jgi:biopolymer transport protein ExbD
MSLLKRRKRAKKEPMELDITSLLDILVILLVFLLKSYNASNLKLDLAKNIKLPSAETRKLGEHALIIQVSQDRKIYLNNKVIAENSDFNALEVALRELAQKDLSLKEPNKAEDKLVNIVLDQEIQYHEMQNIMNIVASHGHNKFKFIVKGDY